MSLLEIISLFPIFGISINKKKQTNKQTNKHLNKQTNRQTNKQTNTSTNKQTDKQTNEHLNKQTNKHPNKQTNKPIQAIETTHSMFCTCAFRLENDCKAPPC